MTNANPSTASNQLPPPMIMPPDLEEWVRNQLGSEKFEWLRDRPLAAVGLAAEQFAATGTHLPDDVIHDWVKLINAKRRELERSQEFLQTLLDQGHPIRDEVIARLQNPT